MADAVGFTVSARLGAQSTDGREAVFSTSGRTITFPGFLRAYVQGSDDPESDPDDKEKVLPTLAAGDALAVQRLEPTGHETRPPARYTEASLVQRLEELGVGRPSTYASIMTTIQDRGYVWKKGTALVPTLRRLRRRRPSREALPPARRLQLHGIDGGRPRSDRCR